MTNLHELLIQNLNDMETIFNDIQSLIAKNYTYTDDNVQEDYGQLEMLYMDDEDSDTYPIVFPIVLIDIKNIKWTSLQGTGTPIQRGTATIDIKLAIDCYDDTHYTSGTADKASERMRHVQELHKLLQGHMVNSVGIMNRIESNFETLRRGIKLYSMRYELSVMDNSVK